MKTHDVLIVGAGAVGLGIAWQLAKAGKKVAALDAGTAGREASSAAAGMIGPQSEALAEDDFFRATVASRDLYPAFVRELEGDGSRAVDYHPDGALHLAFGAGYERRLEAKYLWQKEKSGKVTKMDRAALLEKFPFLHPRVTSGYFASGDQWVDNQALVGALYSACRGAAVEIFENCPAESLSVSGSSLDGVRAGGKEWKAGQVVLASGAWSSQVLGDLLGPRIRSHPVRGQMLSFEVPAYLRPAVPIHAEDVYLVPRGNRLLVGATVDTVGFDRNFTGEGIESLLRGAFETIPDLRSCGIDQFWTGFRPGTGDGWPFLGPTPIQGLHVAFGHYRRGILLLPLTLKAVCEGILKGSLPSEAACFSVQRALS
jgi:glycine oxidase